MDALQKVDSKEVAQDLHHVLTEQPFPIRGWEISIIRTPMYDRSLYSLHEVARDTRLPIQDRVKERLLTCQIKATASFRMNRPILLFDKTVAFSPEIQENQIVTLVDNHQSIVISLDAHVIREYSDECYMVDADHFFRCCEEYSKWAPDRGHWRSKAMLAQLEGIKLNSLSALHQTLGRLSGTIVTQEPDYWGLVEQVAKRKISPQEAVERSRGAIIVSAMPVQ